MLVRLTSNQIPKFWDYIKYGVKESFGYELSDEHNNNILQGLMIGKLQCFVVSEDKKLKANTVIRVIEDELIGTKNLLIYSAYANEVLSNELYQTIFKHLYDYAKSINCDNIVAYSKMSRIIEMAKSVGGDISQTYITFKL